MRSITQDIRFGIRMLLKSPGFAVTAILTLAIGIGLNTAVFSVVNSILFKPLPVVAPQELVGVYDFSPGEFISHTPLAYPDYKDLRDQSQSFSSLTGYSLTALALDQGQESQIVMGEQVTENYFQMLGISAARGRTFMPADGTTIGSDPYVVLSDATWKRRFGGDPEIVGRTIRLNGIVFTVIGIAPPEFPGLFRGLSTELWVPMMMRPAIHAGDDELVNRKVRWLFTMGRLKSGVTLARAQGELQAIAERMKKDYPDTNRDRNIGLLPADEVKLFPGVDKVLYTASGVLMFIVGLVLLIACANVANMMLARATARRREIAIRLAMGAGRARLCRQLLTESLLIAIPGGALGILAASWSNGVLNGFQLPVSIKLSLGLSVDYRVLLFTLGTSLLTAVFFGLAPALRISRTDLASTLKEEASATSGARQKRRLHSVLVVAQVALSLVLLICAGLSVRSMQNAASIDPGFDSNGVVDASFDVGLSGYTPARGAQLYRNLLQSVKAMPGVESAGYASYLPLSFEIRDTKAAAEGSDSIDRKQWPRIDAGEAGPSYFETMRIPVVAGRVFDEHDTVDSPLVVVVNQTLARTFWPKQNPLGKRLRLEDKGPYYEVVGVVRDGKYRTLGEDSRPFIYRALLQNYLSGQILVARTSSDPYALLTAIHQQARKMDERIPIIQLQTLRETTSVSVLLPRMGAALFGLFGLIGVLLAAVGIYGIIAFAASQRTQEIGIRMALGAQQIDILRLLVGQGVALTLTGIAIGLAAALAITRLLTAILYGVGPADLLTLATVSLFFLLISVAACYIPARRATKVDPVHTLRAS